MFKNSIQAQIVDGWFLECSSKILASLGAILHVLNCNIFLPLQTVPFHEYPLSQLHRKDPSVLVQLEFRGQLSIAREHSSMSIKIKKRRNEGKLGLGSIQIWS